MMKHVFLIIIISLLFVGCNSDVPKLSSLGKIKTTAPYITSVSVPAFATYSAGSTLDFFVTFNKSVTVLGTPGLTFITDTGPIIASYANGSGTNSLHFSVSIPVGVIADNGITLTQVLSLNGGSIYNLVTNENAILTFTSPSTSGILINAGDPVITSITPPADATYVTGETVRFIVNFNARVCGTGTPKLPLNVGGTTRYAVWVNEPCAKTMKFDYVVLFGDVDANGIDLTGVTIDLTDVGSSFKDIFNDAANLAYTAAANFSGVKVNGAAPVPAVSNYTPPMDKTYKMGESVDFVVTYNQNVFVDTTNGTPYLKLNIGGVDVRNATYVAGSGTPTPTFRYVVQANDEDTDGITTSGFYLDQGTIKNSSNVNMPNPTAWPPLTNVKVDAKIPSEVSKTSPTGTIKILNENIEYQVTYSEPVIVTGYPRYPITLGASTVYANYASGSGTNTLTFRYNVQEGDEDLNGITTATAIDMNSGSITDAAGNSKSAANLNWPAYSLNVDARNPSILSAEFNTAGAYNLGDTINLTITWSEPVTYSGTASISYTADTSGIVTFTEVSRTTTSLALKYVVAAGKFDYDGLKVSGNLSGLMVIDGVGRTPAVISVPESVKNAYITPPEVARWYDTSEKASIGASTASLTQFTDFVNMTNAGLSGSIPLTTSTYQPTVQYASFSSSQKIQFSTIVSLTYMIAVVDTTGINGSFFETDSGTPTSYLSFSAGNVLAPSCSSGPLCYTRTSGGVWNSISQIGTVVTPYSANTIKIIVVKYPSSTNNYRISPTFTGRLHELFFLNATANTDSIVSDIIVHLQTKYGVTY